MVLIRLSESIHPIINTIIIMNNIRLLIYTICCLTSSLGHTQQIVSIPRDDAMADNLAIRQHVDIQKKPQLPIFLPKQQGDDDILVIDSDTLLHDEALLRRLMVTVVRQQNIVGIRKILPLYIQLNQPNPILAAFAQGLLALAEQDISRAIDAFTTVVNEEPGAIVARYYLAIAAYNNRSFSLAQQQLDLLKQQNLPKPIAVQVQNYLDVLAARSAVTFNISLTPIYDRNINNAPDQRHYGNFTFNPKITDSGVYYQLSTEKDSILSDNFYLRLSGDIFGKKYRHERDYDDTSIRLSTGIGYANQHDDVILLLNGRKRWFAHNPYTQSIGVQGIWTHKWNDNFMTSINLGHERETFANRTFLNNHSQLMGISGVWFVDDSQYINIGGQVLHHGNTRDREDSYRALSTRLNWYKKWSSGIGMEWSFNYTHTDYDGPTLFTNNANRKDNELLTSLSLSHKKIQFYQFQPKLTLQYLHHQSNSIFNQYTKKEVYFNFFRTF